MHEITGTLAYYLLMLINLVILTVAYSNTAAILLEGHMVHCTTMYRVVQKSDTPVLVSR